MEHALSAYSPELPHGAGLIMLSEAYFSFFADKVPERFELMAAAMGHTNATDPMVFVEALKELQAQCGVAGMKLSDYGIDKADIPAIAQNARDTMGGLFDLDRHKLSLEDTIAIIAASYR